MEIGPYRHIKKLGEGAFGEVFQAKTPRTATFYRKHPVVAIKVIKNSNAYRTDWKAKEEANLLKRLNHPNIVKYLNSFVDTERQFCIIMEYCDFGDMNMIVPEEPDEGIVWGFMSLIANGLEFIHGQGIVHRDLKPDNILCKLDAIVDDRDDDGDFINVSCIKVKIGDFGIAKLMTKKHWDNYYTRTAIGKKIVLWSITNTRKTRLIFDSLDDF